jgi:hypothetical protein
MNEKLNILNKLRKRVGKPLIEERVTPLTETEQKINQAKLRELAELFGRIEYDYETEQWSDPLPPMKH